MSAVPSISPTTENHTNPSTNHRRQVKRKKILTRIEARDRWYLLWFILTTKCRRIPWNKFYNNANKRKLFGHLFFQCLFISVTEMSPFPAPAGAVCCDNCEPNKFRADTIKLTDPNQLQLQGRQRKSSPELFDAVKQRLEHLREEIVSSVYGNQAIITGRNIMQDDLVNTFAERARLMVSVEAIKQRVRWHWRDQYGQQVVDAIAEVLPHHPDTITLAQETQVRERALKALLKMAKRDLREKIGAIADACFMAVQTCPRSVDDPTLLHVPFKWLPRKNVGCIFFQVEM